MFVRRRRDISEQSFPENMEKLGYFINENDEVRQINNPTERFEYKVFKNQRLNERRREAFIVCFRRLALERLSNLGLRTLKLSQSPTSYGHVTILHTPDLAHNTNKLLLLFPDENVDLGIWSIRSIDGENGSIRIGTMEAVVARAIREGYSVIIGNTGALIYDPESQTTVTSYCFAAKLKPWNIGGRIRQYDPTWNVVPGNEDPESHVTMVFEKVVKAVVPKETKIFILAAGTGAGAVVQYFDRTYTEKWKDRIQACAFSEPTYSVSALESSPFKMFLNKLARAYIVNGIVSINGTNTNSTNDDSTTNETSPSVEDNPPSPTNSNPDAPEQIADLRFGCSTFAANTLFHEIIIPKHFEEIMDYFELARTDPEWCNPSMVFESRVEDGLGEPAMREALEKVRLAAGQTGVGNVWGDGSTQGCGW